MMTEISS